MKKILSFSLILAAFSVAFSGCLKDKGFDNHTYGINDPDTQPPGVGFPLGTGVKPKNDFGLDVSASTQVVSGFVFVNIEAGAVPKSDVHITLVNNTTNAGNTGILDKYNAANGTAILALPPAVWNVATSLTILAGTRNIEVPINVTNTIALNANLQYAIGIRISAVDAGYKIASNLQDLLIVFSVKNQYDGRYTLRGQFYHPSQSPGFDWFTVGVQMHTTGPNSVKMYWPGNGYYHPGLFGGSLNAFGSQEPEYTVDPATKKITVQNAFAGAVTFYTMGLGFNNAGYNSRWEPTEKTMYDCFGYNLSGQNFVLGTSRMWIDTLIRTGPR